MFLKDDTNLIRPLVFNVASKMAMGELFSFAIPVLANIYDGLNEISNSTTSGNCSVVLPFHYVYGSLGKYFDTHFSSSTSDRHTPLMTKFSGVHSTKSGDDSHAHGLFRNCDNFRMDHLARVSTGRQKLTDDSHLHLLDSVYLTCLHYGYVSLRQENYRIVQPYSPHP